MRFDGRCERYACCSSAGNVGNCDIFALIPGSTVDKPKSAVMQPEFYANRGSRNRCLEVCVARITHAKLPLHKYTDRGNNLFRIRSDILSPVGNFILGEFHNVIDAIKIPFGSSDFVHLMI